MNLKKKVIGNRPGDSFVYLSWLLKLDTDFVSFSMFPASLSNNDLSSDDCCAFNLSSLLPGLCWDCDCANVCCWGADCEAFCCGKGCCCFFE